MVATGKRISPNARDNSGSYRAFVELTEFVLADLLAINEIARCVIGEFANCPRFEKRKALHDLNPFPAILISDILCRGHMLASLFQPIAAPPIVIRTGRRNSAGFPHIHRNHVPMIRFGHDLNPFRCVSY